MPKQSNALNRTASQYLGVMPGRTFGPACPPAQLVTDCDSPIKDTMKRFGDPLVVDYSWGNDEEIAERHFDLHQPYKQLSPPTHSTPRALWDDCVIRFQ